MEQLLQKIGLTEGESKIYLALVELGSTTTGSIIRKSGVSSSKVYIILDKLLDKGLVSYILKDDVKYFQTTDPRFLLDYLSEKQSEIAQHFEQITKILPTLQQMRTHETQLQEATMSQGYKGYQNSLLEFISNLKENDEFLVFGARRNFGKEFENALRKFYTSCDERRIRTRLVYNSEFREILKIYKPFNLVKVRFVSHITPSTIVIGKDAVILIAYGDDPRQVTIKSQPIAQSFWDFFESMWAIAKE